MIPLIAALGLAALGLATWRDPNARSWLFFTLGFIMAVDEGLEAQAKRHPWGTQFLLLRRVLAAAFAALIIVSVFL
jgi:hypothetical protein